VRGGGPLCSEDRDAQRVAAHGPHQVVQKGLAVERPTLARGCTCAVELSAPRPVASGLVHRSSPSAPVFGSHHFPRASQSPPREERRGGSSRPPVARLSSSLRACLGADSSRLVACATRPLVRSPIPASAASDAGSACAQCCTPGRSCRWCPAESSQWRDARDVDFPGRPAVAVPRKNPTRQPNLSSSRSHFIGWDLKCCLECIATRCWNTCSKAREMTGNNYLNYLTVWDRTSTRVHEDGVSCCREVRCWSPLSPVSFF